MSGGASGSLKASPSDWNINKAVVRVLMTGYTMRHNENKQESCLFFSFEEVPRKGGGTVPHDESLCFRFYNCTIDLCWGIFAGNKCLDKRKDYSLEHSIKRWREVAQLSNQACSVALGNPLVLFCHSFIAYLFVLSHHKTKKKALAFSLRCSQHYEIIL